MAKSIRVILTGDEKDLSRAFKNAEHDANRFDGAIGIVKKGLAGLAVGAGVAVGAVGTLAFKIGKDSIAGYREHMAAAAQTAQVLKTTGGAAKVTADDVDKLTETLGRKAKVDDDVVRAGTNMLLTFTNIRNEVGAGNDIFTQANAIALDMSKSLGTDLAGQAIQLGKALNDPIAGISALSRVGVTFTAEQKEQIKTMVESGDVIGAQKVILAELNKEFGGTAEAVAKTKGPMTDFNLKLDEIKDTIGKKLIEEGLPLVGEFVAGFLGGLGVKGKEGGVIGSMDDLKKMIEDFDLKAFADDAKAFGEDVATAVTKIAVALERLWDIGVKVYNVLKSIDEFGDKFKSGDAWIAEKLSGLNKNVVIVQGEGGALPGRAGGGSVTANTPYWVGEKGPELHIPDSSGRILPSGAAAAPPPHVQVTVMVGPEQVAAIVRSEIIRTGRANVSAWGEVA